MHTDHWTIDSIAAIALLARCRHTTPTSLPGTYGPSTATKTMTFHRNGTLLLNMGGGPSIASKYSISDGKLGIALPGGEGRSVEMEFKIDGNGCLTSDAEGNPIKKVCNR